MPEVAKDDVVRAFSSRFPALCKSLVEYIREELRTEADNYCELLELPRNLSLESEKQRDIRTSRIQDWIEELNGSGTDFGGFDPEVILNKILREIWRNGRDKKLSWESYLDNKIASQTTSNKRRAVDEESQPRKRRATTVGEPGLAPYILTHLLEVLEKNHPEYAPILASGLDLVREKVMEFIRPEVKQLFSEGRSLTINDLLSIGGDVTSNEAGVYIHIIRGQSTSFYLYVGQAQVLERRIRDHQTPRYRLLNPSLHYHVLDSSPAMRGSFVVITCGQFESTVRQSYLNIIEMFICLLLQTLPEKTLRKFLPDRVEILNPGAHLNLAAPIYQGLSNPGWSLLLARHSSDPLIYDYYKRRLGIRAQQRRADQLELTRNGGLRQLIGSSASTLTFTIGCLNMTIYVPFADTTKYGLVRGDLVFTEFLVTAGRNPDAWALDALDEDPGNRIAIRISGVSIKGDPFFFFLHKMGDKTAKKANSIFDFIDGVEDTVDSVNTPRRFFGKNRTLGRYENCLYT